MRPAYLLSDPLCRPDRDRKPAVSSGLRPSSRHAVGASGLRRLPKKHCLCTAAIQGVGLRSEAFLAADVGADLGTIRAELPVPS